VTSAESTKLPPKEDENQAGALGLAYLSPPALKEDVHEALAAFITVASTRTVLFKINIWSSTPWWVWTQDLRYSIYILFGSMTLMKNCLESVCIHLLDSADDQMAAAS
jgi:hypothetical protein